MKRFALIEARKNMNLTQADLARKLKLAVITVRKIESGDRNPSSKTAVEFGVCLGADIKVLFPDIFLPNLDTKSINVKQKVAQ